jgi:NAD/NADP transhydrogenase beta subunit
MDQATLFFTIAVFLIIGLLWWIVSTVGRVRIAARQSDVRKHLIDKISSQESVLALLAQGDRAALESLLGGFEEPQPYHRILSSVQAGIVLLVFGGAMIACTAAGVDVPVVVGILTAALGLGLTAAAAISYRLSKSWGLLEARDKEVPRRQA